MEPSQTPLESTRARILEAAIPLFNDRGLKFTMDELAASLGMSKKTIYAAFPSKEKMLEEMVDYVFDFIQRDKAAILGDDTLPYLEKLRRVLTTLTDKYESIDLRRLYDLESRYGAVYAKVARRLETGWEGTTALLEQGIREGALRPFPIPIFKLMMETTLQQFFRNDVLLRSGISYQEALGQVVDILLRGILSPGEELPQ